MSILDKLLTKITMYQLVVYALVALVGLSIVLAFFGRLAASPTALVASLLLVVGSAYLTDRAFSRLFGIPTTMQSSLITGLIIFLIVQPANSVMTGLALLLAGAVSSASKFLLAYQGKHVFNPAAFAAALLTLTGLQPTTWWIGSSIFWPFTLVFGAAIVRKIRRAALCLTFIAVSVGLQLLLFLHGGQPIVASMKQSLIASPLLFLATVMLTEPATMPPRRNQQQVFAALVAILYVTAWKLGPLSIYPEVALLIGNLFAFVVSPKFKVRLRLKEIQQISDRVYNYVFQPDRSFTFRPGQYMEWTLAGVPYDSRGNRRTFTIASSPTEPDIHLGLKYYEPASTYKATFQQLQIGDIIYASQLAGDFILPADDSQKLAFVAGGIGITPFRSMIAYLTDRQVASDIVLLYIVSDPREFAYSQQLEAAGTVGIKTIPIVTNSRYESAHYMTAKLSTELIAKLVPDYAERVFYLSGPSTMVDASKQYLKNLGIANQAIQTDHFSGY